MPLLLQKNKKIIGTYKPYQRGGIINHYGSYAIELVNILYRDFKKDNNDMIYILEKEYGTETNIDDIIFYIIYFEDKRIIGRYDKNNQEEVIISHEVYDSKDDIYFIGNEHSNGKIKGYGKCVKYDYNTNNIIELKNGYICENKFFYCFDFFDSKDESNKLYLTMPNLFNFNSYSNSKSFLHQCPLKYKSTTNNWICDFCLKNFKGTDDSFGCRNCGDYGFDLCPECLFEDENKDRNKLYIKLKNLNFNEITFTKNEFKIKSIYHNHELIFNSSTKRYQCFKCEKIYNYRNFNRNYIISFACGNCKISFCENCIINQKENISELKMNLNKCIFKIKKNSNDYIYGYFIKEINGNNLSLLIYETYENFKFYIKGESFDIILLNNSSIKIYLNDITNYYIFSQGKFLTLQMKNYYFNNCDIFPIDYDTNIINNSSIDLQNYYDNKPIVFISLDKNDIIQINFGIIKKNNANNEFIISNSVSQLYTNKYYNFPIMLLKNNKLIGKISNEINKGIFAIILKYNIFNKNKYDKIKKIFEKDFKVKLDYNYNEYYLKTIFNNNEGITIIRYDKNRNIEEIVSHEINDIYFIGKEHYNGKIKGNDKCVKYDDNTNDIIELKNGLIWENKFYFFCNYFYPNKENNKLYLTMPYLFDFNSSTEAKSFLHQCPLKYKSATVNWICDFCLKNFKGTDDSFGCRNCGDYGFDLCPECLFEDENKDRNKLYIKLNNLNFNEITFNKNEFKIKSNYHNHELIYEQISKESVNCLKCNKCNNKDLFICSLCNINICSECLLHEKEEIINLLNKLNNSFFKININNLYKDIFGCVVVYGCDYYFNDKNGFLIDMEKNIDKFYLLINESYEILMKYIKEDYIEIILFNKKIIKIQLKYLRRAIIHSDTNISLLRIDLAAISNKKDAVVLFFIDNTFMNWENSDYNNKLIFIPSINNNEIELNYGIFNSNQYNKYEFFIENCTIKNKIFGLPLFISNKNNRIIGIYKQYENNKNIGQLYLGKSFKIIRFNECECLVKFFLNLRPNSKDKNNAGRIIQSNSQNQYCLAVESINDYYYSAQIEIKSVKIDNYEITVNQVIKRVSMPFDPVGGYSISIFNILILNNIAYKMSLCNPKDWPYIDENTNFTINFRGKLMNIKFPFKVKASPIEQYITLIAEYI